MASGGKRPGAGRPKNIENDDASNRQLQAEKLRLEIRFKELALQEKEGQLVNKESVMKTLADVLTVTKTKLQNIPRKLAVQCQGQDANQIEALLTKAVREALQELVAICEEKKDAAI